ncbi:alpha/beta hydrolase family protein [Paenibacillus sp. YYML68]|uniref:alpha/beta hydrolase n=1 Tax=Paenibacillus sp. YYML68 TaxID=2909250 RepID=UPI00248FA920|nr:alpha/beta hydrolase family protein [Paenibacillus sp. YYML68]
MGVRSFSFFSGALYRRKVCQVYVPDSYEQDEDRRYPVVYLLHGLYGDATSWTVKGNAEATLNAMIASKQLSDCIVVMPDDGGYGHGTFYINWYDGTGRFEDYILYDLIPAVDREFRTIADRAMRSVVGLSMGGYGAVVLSLRNPDTFGAAASISGVLMSVSFISDQELRTEVPRMIGPLHGPHAKEVDVHMLAARRAREEQKPALHMNCGRSDFLYPVNLAFKATLEHLGYEHEYMEFDGEHNWDYFGTHLVEALTFIERTQHRSCEGESPSF